MGQAKQRGTYEQRREIAIVRQNAEKLVRKAEIAKRDHEADMRENNMSPEQKRRRAENHAILSAFSYYPNSYKMFR